MTSDSPAKLPEDVERSIGDRELMLQVPADLERAIRAYGRSMGDEGIPFADMLRTRAALVQKIIEYGDRRARAAAKDVADHGPLEEDAGE